MKPHLIEAVADSGGTCADPAEAKVAGSIYGFEVRSPLAFRFLRGVDGGVPLRVQEWQGEGEGEGEGDADGPWDLEWQPPRYNLHARLYVRPDHDEFWIDREGSFRIDPSAPSIAVPPSADSVRLEERLWGVPAGLCIMRRGGLPLHAAAVEVDGGALLIGGPGRFGKTTLAGAFLRSGHRVLAEDLASCALSPMPVVYPGPALLRMREDVYRRVEFPGTEAALEEPGRVHLTLNPAQRGDGRPVPLRAIVFLRPPADRISLERLDGARCLPNLWKVSWKLPGQTDAERWFQGIASLAAQVPVWSLQRPFRFDELDRVVEAVIATCLPT